MTRRRRAAEMRAREGRVRFWEEAAEKMDEEGKKKTRNKSEMGQERDGLIAERRK